MAGGTTWTLVLGALSYEMTSLWSGSRTAWSQVQEEVFKVDSPHSSRSSQDSMRPSGANEESTEGRVAPPPPQQEGE